MIRRALFAGLAFVLVMVGIAQSVDVPRAVAPGPAEVPQSILDRLGALEERNAQLQADLDALERGMLESSPVSGPLLARFPVPAEVILCGERLPLERADVYSRFEEEWTRYLVNQHWMIKWLRRSREVFPYVEARLAAAQMPDDLKYVLVVESGLESRAYSSAGASGWWQFIKATGKRYGLDRNNVVDERRDLGLATDAAMSYFAELHGEFGSWPLALSAYNAGERRVRDEIEAQGETDFYRLSLPRETEAYWFKAAVVKILMENPEAYGFVLTEDPWVRAVCDTLQLKVTKPRVQLRDVASAAGISYREFRELNPAFRGSWVPRGTHRFVIPHQGVDGLTEAVDGIELAARQRGEVLFEAVETVEAEATEGQPEEARPGLDPGP
jgi:hypothetical protein